jgi:hypothetical protein
MNISYLLAEVTNFSQREKEAELIVIKGVADATQMIY